MSIFLYLKTHGIDKFKITLVKEKTAVNKNNTFTIDQLRKKDYRANNNDSIRASNKEYYKEDKQRWDAIFKAKLAARSNCECGDTYSAANHHVHVRSQKHYKNRVLIL
ncbi:hypothetical protein Plhal703r1_c17g0078741 [Plasmopara halstedii]